jgi:hypothetical protein
MLVQQDLQVLLHEHRVLVFVRSPVAGDIQVADLGAERPVGLDHPHFPPPRRTRIVSARPAASINLQSRSSILQPFDLLWRR